MSSVLSGVVFDFDGVIVDSHPVHVRAWRKFFESVGLSVSEEQLKFVRDGRKREEILRHFLGDLTHIELLEYGHRKDLIFQNEAGDVRPIHGLLNFLHELAESGLALSIASSGSRYRLDFLLNQLGLSGFFGLIVTGDDVRRGKPDPAIFLAAARGLGIDPSRLVAFEDAEAGVQAAKAAGMKCIGIEQGNGSSPLLGAGADYVIPDFSGLSWAKLWELFA